MNGLWNRWAACAALAALSACSPAAETNSGASGPGDANAAVEANAVVDDNAVAEDKLADAAAPPAGNEAAAAPKAAPAAKAAPKAAAPQESYAALGQEPGWALKIAAGRIHYTGNYGEKTIDVARPEPRPSFNGRRYVTPRLTVDITYVRCNDAMSGFGFEHQVTVIADGETYKGCGGARKKAWDM
jgi:uncharacterized membrane protein